MNNPLESSDSQASNTSPTFRVFSALTQEEQQALFDKYGSAEFHQGRIHDLITNTFSDDLDSLSYNLQIPLMLMFTNTVAYWAQESREEGLLGLALVMRDHVKRIYHQVLANSPENLTPIEDLT